MVGPDNFYFFLFVLKKEPPYGFKWILTIASHAGHKILGVLCKCNYTLCDIYITLKRPFYKLHPRALKNTEPARVRGTSRNTFSITSLLRVIYRV
jgi:hypothetical protein